MKEYARKYYELGLNPTCISYIKTKYNINENNPQKSPCHAWKRWQIRRPLLEEVMDLNWNISSGIGSVLGHATRCIDIDNCNDYDFVKDFLRYLGLPADYEWVVKSPNGFHIHIKSGPIYFATNVELIDGVLPVYPNNEFSSKFSKVELRWANHIVLPPTIINGKKYNFINVNFPSSIPLRVDMFVVLQALTKFCGNYFKDHGNFEANKMIFQLCAPSQGYPFAQAALGSLEDNNIKEVTNSAGFIEYNKLPKNIKAGELELDFSYQSAYAIKTFFPQEFFIDIETTGLITNELDYDNYPRIIQIATYSFKKGLKTFYVKPDGFVVPHEIELLTGITNDFLMNNGISLRDAFISIEIPDDCIIIGHNLDFDLSVLDSEYLRLIKNPKTYVSNKHRSVSQAFCTMKKFATTFNVKYPKLSEMFLYFFDDLPQEKMHNATNDLVVLIDCYYIMCLYGYIKDDYENQIIL